MLTKKYEKKKKRKMKNKQYNKYIVCIDIILDITNRRKNTAEQL